MRSTTDHCHISLLVSLKSLESIGSCGRDPDSPTMDQWEGAPSSIRSHFWLWPELLVRCTWGLSYFVTWQWQCWVSMHLTSQQRLCTVLQISTCHHDKLSFSNNKQNVELQHWLIRGLARLSGLDNKDCDGLGPAWMMLWTVHGVVIITHLNGQIQTQLYHQHAR